MGPLQVVRDGRFSTKIPQPPFRFLLCYSPFQHSHRVLPHGVPKIHAQLQLETPHFVNLT